MKSFNRPNLPPLGGKPKAVFQKVAGKAGSLATAASQGLSALFDRLKPGETVDDFTAQLKQRAEEEARKFQPLFRLGEELCRELKNGTRARRFLDEVVRPLERKELGAKTAATRTNDIFGMNVLQRSQQNSGPLGNGITIAIGIGASLGCVVGVEKCYGLAMTGFLNAPRGFEWWSRSIQVGTVDASVSGSIEFSPGAPDPAQPEFLANSPLGETSAGWDGWGMGYAVGGGWGATLGGSIGFKPNFLEPIHKWKFKSLAVQFGGGGGASLGMWLQGTAARELPAEIFVKR